MKSKIKSIINALEKEYPVLLRYLQVDHLFNKGYARIVLRNSLNTQALRSSIVERAEAAGLRCAIEHNPGSIHFRIEFEKA